MISFDIEKNIARLNFISLLLVIALLSLGMGYLFIYGYNDVFKTELKKVEADYIFVRKEKIQNIIDLKISNIQSQHQKVPDILKDKIKNQVFTAHNIASHIYQTYKDTKNEKEIQSLIIDAINSIRQVDGEVPYFLLCENKRNMTICPTPDNTNSLIFDDYPDDKAPAVFQKIMRRTKSRGEAYFTFKDGSESVGGDGGVFLKRFEVYNWFIGSLGRYHKIELSIKKDLLDGLIDESTRGQNPHAFEIYELIEGNMGKQSLQVLLHHENPSLEGQELTVFFQDAKGSRYIKKLIDQVKLNGSTFMENWDINKVSAVPKLKMTYYKLYPQWNWIIALGFHIESSDLLNIQHMMNELEDNIQSKIKSATVLFLFFILVSILISVAFSRGIGKIVKDYKKKVEDRSLELAAINTQLNSEITVRRSVETSLRKSEEQLRRFASEVQLTEEKERRRIAGDLHDSIGASLAISNLKLEILSGKIETPDISKDLNMVHDNIKQVIQQTRSLTFQLSPQVLYQMGLEAALAGLAEQTQKLHGILTEFSDDKLEKYLEEDVRIHIFRSVRELLVNVIKHAWAKHIKISVARVGDQIQITVADDGVGIKQNDQAISPEEGGKFGLFSIRERLRLFGGYMEIQSENGHGTEVIMRAPLILAENVEERVS
ncbi:MAG: cache domain-containing protein [SAR324 cluster bacterium]|nr:cache domain-containing protein [SAR324 cluster bacterium]